MIRSSPGKGTGPRRLAEEAFLEGLEATQLVESVTRRTVGEAERGATAAGGESEGFAVDVFRRQLEVALGEVRSADAGLARRQAEALERCRRAERAFREQSSQLLRVQEDCASALDHMDGRMGQGSASAVGVGERLSALSAQRESCDAALEVMEYLEAMQASGEAQALVFVDPQRLHEREAVLKNLELITAGLDPQDQRTAVGQAVVASQCRQLEKSLISNLRQAVNVGDTGAMQQCVASLLDFGAQRVCVDVYLCEACGVTKRVNLSSARVLDRSRADSAVRKYFARALAAVEREQSRAGLVFPEPEVVLGRLAELLLGAEEKGENDEQEGFGLAVSGLLAALERGLGGPDADEEEAELLLQLQAQVWQGTQQLAERLESGASGTQGLATRLADSVFSGVREKYLQRETELQERLWRSRVEAVEAGGVLCPQLLESRLNARSLLWESAQEEAERLAQEDATRDPSLADLERVQGALSLHAAALSRATLLSATRTVAANVTALYRLLLRLYGQDTLIRAVDLHLQLLPDRVPSIREPIDTSFLRVALTVNSVVLALERFHHVELLPRVSRASVNEPTKCNTLRARLLTQLESRLSEGLQRLAFILAARGQQLLHAHQGRRDFRPPPHSPSPSGPTATASAVCDFVKTQVMQVRGCLDGGNAEVFLRALGSELYHHLFTHLSSLTVALGEGGAQLLMDTTRYADTMRLFQLPGLDAQFAQLKAMSSIHCVDEKAIRPLLKDLVANGVPLADLRSFLETHEHYSTAWAEWLPK